MFIIDGVAYAGEPVEEMRIQAARYTGDCVFLVTFSTGETRLFDASCLFGYPAFERLKDEDTLKSFAIEYGIMTWCDGEIDIAPETLYERSFAYQEVACVDGPVPRAADGFVDLS